ncbi:MAG TPA: phosphonate C-P lyase system protein PhnH [Xanthobacteraceae bacterium]|nr:phosphonate C-P lyase system protein PhnH [Xanthobacteraceae bacterium]
MTVIAAGFSDSVLGAQKAFRAVMDALARPGRMQTLPQLSGPPAPLSAAAGALVLALADHDTPVWLDPPLAAAADVAAWLRFHTGAPVASDPVRAAFALVADPLCVPPFSAFALGTPEYPDRSTTVVLQVERFTDGPVLTLTGPGIAGSREFCASPLPDDFAERLIGNRALFPRGIDVLLVTADQVAALPRSVRVQGG